ncbi:transcription repressor [Rhynchospora pubera]|uniref:Transcription repressor n=1 Tax=Rhynchospora pubera TaxID=906938 RepID=A0AAV8BXR8_9POAL|nr:transcription repressor [Rhynchospora pubera]KAJ4799403.1 transcription repressor [Rhynchospora pubera]
MVKKLGLTSLFSKDKETSSPSWPWLSCNPRTNSFRDTFPAYLNSAYIDSTDSCFTHSSTLTESESISTSSDPSTVDQVESVIHAVKSGRLFFEPDSTSSILEEGRKSKQSKDVCGIEGCAIAVELESEDPYKDFIKSMEEMVTANGVKDWNWLEDMLGLYLRVNPESAHTYIVDAFVDLLLGLACSSDSCNCSSSSSTSSFRFEFDEEQKRKDDCLSCEIAEVEESGT